MKVRIHCNLQHNPLGARMFLNQLGVLVPILNDPLIECEMNESQRQRFLNSPQGSAHRVEILPEQSTTPILDAKVK